MTRLAARSDVRARFLALAAFVLLRAEKCQDDEPPPPKPVVDGVVRGWSFASQQRNAAETLLDEGTSVGGRLDETHRFGSLLIHPPGYGPEAMGEIFSSELGKTYWVGAEAPHSNPTLEGAPVGSVSRLTQHQYFRKLESNAALSLVVSRVALRVIDSNNSLPLPSECPWHLSGESYADCLPVMSSTVRFAAEAYTFEQPEAFFRTGGFAELHGFQGTFDYEAYTDGGSRVRLWDKASFEFDTHEIGSDAGLYLSSPITIEIPLSKLPVGATFYVTAKLSAETLNLRQRESYVSAFLRDPQGEDGLSMSYAGLEAIEAPAELPPGTPSVPAPACDEEAPEAGTLEFAAQDFGAPELPGHGATVLVRRSGGSRGAVSVKLVTNDGSAQRGVDYTAVEEQVLFADGEEGERAVHVPLGVDGVAEPDETVELELSEPGGCAALGERTTAVLSILDDDRDVRAPTFTVGGTVSGLEGAGLVLREVTTGFELSPENGSFAFDYAFPDGRDYEVRIATQPTDPIQVCSVENAQGTIAGADVGNVSVTCTVPPASGSLDAAFGSGGKVTEGVPGGAVALALQPDGKIVVVGARALARFDSDGELDTEFGSGGVVSSVFSSGLLDEAHAVALQPDGKIVVVGAARVGTQDDFGVARFEADGSPDRSFGTDGVTTTDFTGDVDRAWAVLVAPDGGLLVAGHAATSTPLGVDSDFAVARYTELGQLDLGFGSGGKMTTNIAGRTDLAYGAALDGDGYLVVVGRVAPDGGADPDVGVVRYDDTGHLDLDFGQAGIVRRDFGGWDEAADVELTSDGKITVAVKAVVGLTFQLAVARLHAGGGLDEEFGGGGFVATPFSDQHDYSSALALDDAGRIVLVGQSSNLDKPDFAIARFDSSGALDATFGEQGRLSFDFFGASDDAACVAIQPDGKLIVGGVARNGTTTGLGLLRLAP